MQTGQLDTGGLRLPHDQLTPAADIYSLAKTTYTLLAGESPRRFAQHALTDLPLHVRDTRGQLQFCECSKKRPRHRPEARYQTVEEFWDDLADASLPPTRPLQMVSTEDAGHRRNRAKIFQSSRKKFTEAAPPRPQFAVPHQREAFDCRFDTLETAAHRGSDQS